MNNNSTSSPLIFVLSDGIDHSVFAGQVITPLIKKLKNNEHTKIYIVSFEKKSVQAELIKEYEQLHKELKIITFRRLPFFGKISLYPSIISLKRFLKNFDHYELIARGALSGYIAINTCTNEKCKKLTVQARGLLTQEYSFMRLHNRNLSHIKKWFHKFRHNLFYEVETDVYQQKNIIIEAVSTKLRDYLIIIFEANKNSITIATHDIPEQYSQKIIAAWRDQTRNFLGISPNAYVYCYNGALKSWQCADQIISFFKQQTKKNRNSFLLVLTEDKNFFQATLATHAIDPRYFCVISVKHADIYRYLSAADTGIIFREPHIVSWVSRPVKAMEYEAVGLKIIHNGTVAWLNERYPKNIVTNS